MTDPIWKPWHNLEALYLGEIIVGRVSVSHNAKNNQASYIFNLGGISASWKTARTVELARQDVEAELAAWLNKAGLR